MRNDNISISWTYDESNKIQQRTGENIGDKNSNYNYKADTIYISLLENIRNASIKSYSKKDQTLRGHRNRCREIIEFIDVKYLSCALQTITSISNTNSQNQKLY